MKNTQRIYASNDGRIAAAISSLLILTFISLSSLAAQDFDSRSERLQFRLTGGLGIASSDFLSAGTTVSILHKDRIYSVRVIDRTEAPTLPRVLEPLESAREVSLLYGVASRAKYGYASASIGLGIVDGIQRGELKDRLRCEKKPYNTVGVPLDCQIFLTPFSFMGIGVTGFANLNQVQSYAGANLCIQLGQL